MANTPGACFSKVPKLFWHISGDTFSLYLQNEGVLRHKIFHLFEFLFPLQHMERPALQNERVGVIRMAFRAQRVFGTFEKRTPDSVMKQLVLHFSLTFEANKKLTFGKIKGAVYFRKGQVCILSK